ncbi:hypothetical protein BSKO_06313 [Bryopsis sp. KO-2023]|nr:hypothetical protein BSKO_06313 [Bryopsis sp. KO-2023]
MAFYTLGYASFDLAAICEAIGRAEATLVDVRMSPFSKKPGFRRKELQAALAGRYAHLSEFGNVNYGERHSLGIEIRDYVKGREILGGIASRTGRPVVLMCGCKDLHGCHRGVLAQALAKDGFDNLGELLSKNDGQKEEAFLSGEKKQIQTSITDFMEIKKPISKRRG